MKIPDDIKYITPWFEYVVCDIDSYTIYQTNDIYDNCVAQIKYWKGVPPPTSFYYKIKNRVSNSDYTTKELVFNAANEVLAELGYQFVESKRIRKIKLLI